MSVPINMNDDENKNLLEDSESSENLNDSEEFIKSISSFEDNDNLKRIIKNLGKIYLIFFVLFLSCLIIDYKLFDFEIIYLLIVVIILFHITFAVNCNKKILIQNINIKSLCLQLILSIKSIAIVGLLSQLIIIRNDFRSKMIDKYIYTFYILNIYFYYCSVEIILILLSNFYFN